MNEISSEELKKIAADILFDLDRVCESLGLRYSIGFGTMIGAVRHKGFIPWDDDIDIIMPREDYNILARDGVSYLKPNHKLLSINCDERFGAPLPKIINTDTIVNQIGHVSEKMDIGVYIDIFILDKVPSDVKSRNRIYNKCRYWQAMWRFSGYAPTKNNNFIVKVLRLIFNRTTLAAYFAKKLMNVDLLTQKYTSGLYSILIFDAYGYENNVQKLDEFDECLYVDFENGKVRILSRYDEYLTTIYGDYMKLPPVEQQVTHHNFVAYYR